MAGVFAGTSLFNKEIGRLGESKKLICGVIVSKARLPLVLFER